MTTLVKCRFCLQNGSNYVSIPEGELVRCEYCKRVQPVKQPAEVDLIGSKPPAPQPASTRFIPPASGSFFA